MMLDISNYYSKKKELDFYIEKLFFLDRVSSEQRNPYERYLNDRMKSKVYDLRDFVVILKSNAYMMMYNMIESTTKEIVWAIYDQINSSDLTYEKVSLILQKLWEKHQFLNLDSGNAKTEKYKKKAHTIITNILDESPIRFYASNFKLSGNADFDKILEKMGGLGVNIDTSNIGQYKDELKTIKDNRNKLAHGAISFIESGRDSSFKDIQDMAKHTETYLEQLIKDASNYTKKRLYKK
jgi:hypothetical protein